MRNFFPLLHFNLKTITWNVWIFTIATVGVAIISNNTTREHSGFEAVLSGYVGPLYSLMIGAFFYAGGKNGGCGSGSLAPIQHGEFLFARPVSRRSAWLVRTCLYFILISAAPVILLGFTAAHPDLKLSLYQDATRHAEAAEKLATYQAAFPDSAIEHEPGASHDTLVIRHGWLFLAGWQLLVTVFLAVGLQIVTFLSKKFQLRVLIFYASLVLVLLFSPWNVTDYIEPVFFQFARHWVLVALVTAAILCLVQWLACRRIEEMEVI